MRVLICGSRDWTDRKAIRKLVSKLPPGTVVIEGEARGADRIAREEAEARGLTVERFEADWNRYGKAAGPIRNRRMLVEGKPDICYAFHTDISVSKGTRNMVEQCQKAGVSVTIISGD